MFSLSLIVQCLRPCGLGRVASGIMNHFPPKLAHLPAATASPMDTQQIPTGTQSYRPNSRSQHGVVRPGAQPEARRQSLTCSSVPSAAVLVDKLGVENL